MDRYTSSEYEQSVAIIGMAGVYAEAPNLDAYWQNLVNGHEAVRFLEPTELGANGCPPSLWDDPAFVPASAMLGDEAFRFDADFFGFTPAEARIADPQLRLMLQTSWHAFEDANIVPGEGGGLTGVFAGGHKSDYLLCHLGPEYSIQTGMKALSASLFNGQDHLSTWISYKFGLTGPSLNIQTACSTGLVAVAVACQNLLDYSCDLALTSAGAVFFPRHWGYLAESGSIVSLDGHCRPFDAQASGTITGEGAGALILKRLPDALHDGDAIRGIIRGFAVNNDGSGRAGYTTPAASGQISLLTQALASAQVDPADVGYIEAHGTGTIIGDPVEYAALSTVYGKRPGEPRLLGSVKANLGHLGACAGMAGMHKLLLMLEHGQIPPQINFSSPNPEMNLEEGGFEVCTERRDWPSSLPRLAAISSFGLGGTNCHLILEGPPLFRQGTDLSMPALPLCLSAVSEQALSRLCLEWSRFLKDRPDADVSALTLAAASGRKVSPWRVSIAAQNRRQALAALSDLPTFVKVDAELSGQKTVLVLAGDFAGLEALAAAAAGNGSANEGCEPGRKNTRAEAILAFGSLLSKLGLHPDMVVGAGMDGALAAALLGGTITQKEAELAFDNGGKCAFVRSQATDMPAWICTEKEEHGAFSGMPCSGAELEQKLLLCLNEGARLFLVVGGPWVPPDLIEENGAIWLPLGPLPTSADSASLRDILHEWLGRLFMNGVTFEPKTKNSSGGVRLPLYPFEAVPHKLETSASSFSALLQTGGQSLSLADSLAKTTEPDDELSDIRDCLCAIWNDALGVKDIKPEDDFFQRGGTSIAAVTILSDIKKRTGLNIPMQDLMRLKTINGVMGRLAELAGEAV